MLHRPFTHIEVAYAEAAIASQSQPEASNLEVGNEG